MVSVTLNGSNVDGLVLADDVSVRVGRRNILQPGEPSSLSLTLWLEAWIPVDQGDPITVEDVGEVRFAGRVTDITRTWWEEHPDDPDRWMLGMRIQAAGPLAGWGLAYIGDEPWPAETVSDRADRVAALAGQPLRVQGGGGLRVIARDVDHRTAIDILDELATDAAGWLYDFAGETFMQSLDYRRVPPGDRWQDQSRTWDATGDEAWDDQVANPSMIDLPPSAVGFAPEWQQTTSIANNVRVTWGPTDPDTGAQEFIESQDAASITDHGRHEVTVRTRLESSAEAALRASLVLERAAQPQWSLPDVDVYCELLDSGTAQQLADALPGQRIQVTLMPDPGPSNAFEGCIEGWVERWMWDPDAGTMLRTLTLHLSDIRWSFAVLTWDQVQPTGKTWDQVPTAAWDDVLANSDLEVLNA